MIFISYGEKQQEVPQQYHSLKKRKKRKDNDTPRKELENKNEKQSGPKPRFSTQHIPLALGGGQVYWGLSGLIVSCQEMKHSTVRSTKGKIARTLGEARLH